MFLFLIFASVLSYWGIDKSRRTQIKIAFTLFCFLCFFCMCRGESVCVDTSHYIAIFKYGELGLRFGILYSIIYDVCVFIGGGPHVFLAIMALLTYIPIIVLSQKSENPSLVWLIFIICPAFFMESFNLVRQTAAMSYLLLGYVSLGGENKNIKRAIVWFILACFLHKMAVIVLPFCFLYKYKISKNIVYVSLIGSFALGLCLSMDAFYVLFDRFSMFFSMFENDSSAGTIINHYIENEKLLGEWGLIGMLINLIPFTLLCLFSYTSPNKGQFIFNIFFCGTIFNNLFVSSAFNARIASFMTVASLIYIPMIYNSVDKRQKRLIQFSLFLLFLIFVRKLWGYQISSHSMGILPYSFCF